MASKSEDVYIRVHLDANNAEGELMSLEEAMEKLKKRKDELDALVTANKLTTNDEEYQYIARKFEVVRRLAAETRQSVIKVEEVVSHLTEATTKEIKAAMTKAQRTISTLTRTGEDAQKLALTQEQFIAMKGELDRRNAASEPLQRRLKDITKLTADELDRCVKESGKMVKTLEQGTPEALKMFTSYKRFREEQERMNGEMSYAQASRYAMGRDNGTLSQLTEAGKYLKQYKSEWGQFMSATMGREFDDRIQNITKRQLEMARSIANGTVKASYADMQTALQIIKQRWESLDPTVKKNQTLIHDLGLEYEKLKADINAWGSATMTKADAANVLAQSLRLLKQGTDADANAVAHYIEQLKLAESAEGLTIQNQNMLYSARKRLTDLQRTEVPLQSRGLSAILGDIDEAKSLAQLEELQKELTAFYKTAIVPSEIVESKERLDKLNETIRNFGMKEMPKRSLSEILGEIDKAESLAQLEKLRTELTDFYRNAVVPTEIAESKQRLDKLNETIKNFGVRETNARPLADIFKDIDGAQSLSQLEKFRDELKAVFRDLTDDSEIKAARTKFDQLDQTIKNFGTETVDAFAVLKDPKSYNLSQITAAIKQLEEKFNNIKVGPTFDALRQKMASDINTLKQYKEAAEAALKPVTMSNADAIGFAEGGNGTVAQLREAMKVLEEFREKSLQTNDTTQLAQYNKYIADLKQRIDEATKSVTQMDVATAKWIANGGGTSRTVSDLKEAKEVLEKFKQSLAITDNARLHEVNNALKKIDETLDKVNGKTIELRKGEYDEITGRARDMIKKLREDGWGSAAMRDYNPVIEGLKRLQSAQNLTMYGTQVAVALEKELTDILKGKNSVMLEAVTVQTAEANAAKLLQDQEYADVATLRETIELYKQMIEQEGIDVKTKEERRKKLQELQALEKGQIRLDREDVVNQAKSLLDDDGNVKGYAFTADINASIEALRQLKKQFGTTADEAREYDAIIRKLESSTKHTGNAAKNLAYDEKFVADTLKNLKTAPAEDLEKAMLMCRNRMRDAQTSLTDYVKSAVQLKQMQRQVRGVTDEFKAQSDWLTTNVKKIGNYLGVFGGFYLVRQQFENWFRASMKYDDQLVDIQKTTNMTTQAIHELADGIKRIDTRSSIESLQSLAYSAGKLGVKSVSDVMGFVRAADMLNVSLGEQLGDDAAERLMKVATVMGTTDAYGLEEALMRTGSAITELAKNSAASADPIVAFMSRTAGLAKQSGITTAELAGLGAAVSALGQPVEMSATSFSKMMVQMEKSYKTVGKALKMTDQEMETMRLNLETGNGMDAFLDMLSRVRDLGGLSPTAAIAKDLGSEGSRVIQTLTTLSASYETIEKMVRQSTDAFEANTTVLEEYRKKNNNTAALFERIKNSFSKMFVSPENVEWLNQLLVKLQVLPDAVQQLINRFSWFGDFISGFVVDHVYGLVNALSTLFHVMMGKAVLNGILNLIGQVRTAIVTFASYAAAARAASTATATFTFSLKALQTAINPVFAALSAVLSLWQLFANNEKEVTKWNDSLNDSLDRTQRTASDTTYEMEGLLKKIQETETEEEKAIGLRRQLGDMFKNYIGELDVEKAKYEDLATAIRAANSELRAKQLYEATNQHVKDLEGQANQAKSEQYDAISKALSSRIKTDDRGVAMQIARQAALYMMDDPEKFGLYLDKNKDGSYSANTYGEGIDNFGLSDAERKYQANINAAVKRAIQEADFDVPVKFEKIDMANGTGVTVESKDVYNAVVKNLGQLASDTAALTEAIADAKNEGYSRAAVTAKAANKELDRRMPLEWAKFEAAITRGSTFDAAGQALKQRSGKNTNDGTADDWARDVREMNDEVRRGYERAATFWLQDARDKYTNLDIQRGAIKDKAEQDKITAQMKQLDTQIKNTEAFVDVVAVRVRETTDPNADKKAHREGQEEYKNIIAKVEEFYKEQAAALEQQRLDRKITQYAYEAALKNNERELQTSLAMVRDAIDGDDKGERIWKARRMQMRGSNIAGAAGDETLDRIDATGNVRPIGENLNAGSNEDRAVISGMKKVADENRMNAQKIAVEQAQAIQKAFLERNVLGKLAEQYEEVFYRLGLLLTDYSEKEREVFTGNVIDETELMPDVDGVMREVTNTFRETRKRSLEEMQQDVMDAYLKIGQNIYQYDMSTDKGVEAFRAYVMSFPDLAKKAAELSKEDLRNLYYESYEYAENYAQQITQIVQKSENQWRNMFKQAQSAIDERVKTFNIDELQKANDYLQKWGWSDSVNYKQEVEYRKQRLAIAQEEWEFLKKRAAEELASANAMDDKDPRKKNKVKEAEAKVNDLEVEPQFVLDAMGSLNDAMLKLRENTWGWTADLEKNFEQFGQNIFALRSWYDVNMKHNSAWTNAFGTKEARQKAFASFMDDLKKTLRDMVVERVRAAITAKLQERMIEKAKIPGVSKKDREAKVLDDAQKVADSPVTQQAAEHEAMLSKLDANHRAVEEKEEQHQQIMAKIKGEERQAVVLNPLGEKSPEEKENDDHASFVDQALKQEEGQNIILGGLKKGWKKLFNWKKKSKKDEVSLEKTTADQITDAVEEGGEERSAITQTVEKGISKVMAAQGAENIAQNDATNQSIVQSDAAKAQADTALGIASGSAKTVGQLGWWGIPLIAVISAALSALLSAAMNMVGGGPKSSTKGAKTKLVSGMLTYDGGNVQSFSGVRTYNKGTGAQRQGINMLPVMGDDGRVYMVPEGDLMGKNDMSQFTGMVTRPTLTTVGGAPALVGERGPEMVIGRETTRAMQMDNPELLRAIIEFDKNRSRGFAKTFDSGNVGDASALLGARSEELGVDGSAARGMSEETAVALTNAIAMLSDQLSRPITAKFDMNGKGGAADQMAQGLLNSRRLGDLDSVKRLFGSR